jgi:putative ABC transport system ATP-binding protein
MAMITATNIEKSYTRGPSTISVLRGVNLSVAEGEYVAIMGASGSGKSTLLNILGCLDSPTAGQLELGGVNVSALDDDGLSALRNRKIGFVFQQFILLERTTALDNVRLPLVYADEYPTDAAQRAERSLASVGLADRSGHTAGELSGGEQQRVAIARALINDPAVILADEPTGNLDSESTASILDIFRKLHEGGRTIVLVTHDRMVAGHAQHVVELRDGRISPREGGAS